jgi:hypothetical protein
MRKKKINRKARYDVTLSTQRFNSIHIVFEYFVKVWGTLRLKICLHSHKVIITCYFV